MPRQISGDRRILRTRVIGLWGFLTSANLGAWACAFGLLRHYPLLLGVALLTYGLGLRHGVDADHIAAIDNVTRKLVQEGRRPIASDFFFSLGHPTIVFLTSVGLAASALALKGEFRVCQAVGSYIGTAVSAAFLFAIGLINLLILIALWKANHHASSSARHSNQYLFFPPLFR